jgi:hypothetical protein
LSTAQLNPSGQFWKSVFVVLWQPVQNGLDSLRQSQWFPEAESTKRFLVQPNSRYQMALDQLNMSVEGAQALGSL